MRAEYNGNTDCAGLDFAMLSGNPNVLMACSASKNGIMPPNVKAVPKMITGMWERANGMVCLCCLSVCCVLPT